MKRTARFSVLLLCTILMAVPLAAFAETSAYIDVKKGVSYYFPIQWATAHGICGDIRSLNFEPAKTCTRSMAIIFLWQAYGKPSASQNSCPYTDVSSSDICYPAVCWAAERGLTEGASGTSFFPAEPCTKGQIASFLYRLANGKPTVAGDISFSDVKESLIPAVRWVTKNGIMSGISDAYFAPTSSCNRGQVITYLYRTLAKDVRWNFLFVIFTKTDVRLTDALGKRITLQNNMDVNEISLLCQAALSFENDLYEMSDGVVRASVTLKLIDTPITAEQLTKSTSGYYLDVNHAKTLIEDLVDLDFYDHVTAMANLGGLGNSYWGLGGMVFKNKAGFSFVDCQNTSYAGRVYDAKQRWPSAVFVHEFLHFMEYQARQNKCEIEITLDSGESIGYRNDKYYDLRQFYVDFIRHQVPYGNAATSGVPSGLWRQPPVTR